MTANPTLLSMPLAQNGQKNIIPETQATPGNGLFSQSTGFPAETSLPLGAGGVAPSREDFNGLANLLGGVAFYAQKGWQFQFDAAQDYYEGCVVRDTTDGKLYECLNDVAAGGSVPSADAVNWKEYGVDPSMFANPDLSNLTATGENHFLEQDFAIIYPNGGTELNPATVAVNSRYVETNPFAGYYVKCVPEIFYDGEWGNPEFVCEWASSTNGGYGVSANLYNGAIVVQTGRYGLMDSSNCTGAPFTTANVSTPKPCRVWVWKVGKIPA